MREIRVRPLFSAEALDERIRELAERIHLDFADTPFAILSIAEGARRFTKALLAALAAHGGTPPLVHTIRARRTRGTELGALQIEGFDAGDFAGRDVLVVDDVADEGRTLRAVLDLLDEAESRSARIAVLVSKNVRRVEAIPLDYVGFEVDRGWVVGFGMDVDGELRDLDEIGVVEGTD